jgi:hypothetical protein
MYYFYEGNSTRAKNITGGTSIVGNGLSKIKILMKTIKLKFHPKIFFLIFRNVLIGSDFIFYMLNIMSRSILINVLV